MQKVAAKNRILYVKYIIQKKWNPLCKMYKQKTRNPLCAIYQQKRTPLCKIYMQKKKKAKKKHGFVKHNIPAKKIRIPYVKYTSKK